PANGEATHPPVQTNATGTGAGRYVLGDQSLACGFAHFAQTINDECEYEPGTIGHQRQDERKKSEESKRQSDKRLQTESLSHTANREVGEKGSQMLDGEEPARLQRGESPDQYDVEDDELANEPVAPSGKNLGCKQALQFRVHTSKNFDRGWSGLRTAARWHPP